MVNEFIPAEASVDFTVLADLFLSYGTFASPAFYDGQLSASLALSTEDDEEATEIWLRSISETLGVEAPRTREDAATLLAWRAQARAGLSAEEMSFEPLLPDTLFSLAERVRAVQEWTQGFIEVIDAYGVESDDTLSAQLKEALEDLRAISKLDAADAFEEAGFDDSSEHEGDLLALVEHARMAAILLYLERHPGNPQVESTDELPDVPTLH